MSTDPSCVALATVRPDRERVRGLAFVFVGGLLYASAGLFARGLPFDVWTVLAWRSLAGALFLVAVTALESGRLSWRDYALTRAEWALVPVGAVATLFYIYALTITSVANVMIVYATVPFVTAAVAWLWTREVPSRRVIVASVLALLGVGAMVAGSSGSDGMLLGLVLILFMNVSFALTLVLARHEPARSLTPVNGLALLLAAAVGFAAAPHVAVGSRPVALMLLFGLVTVGLAMSLFMAGARRAPSAEVALIGISDVVLGPAMVWLAFGEVPPPAAFVGGSLVTAGLLWAIWPDLRGRMGRPARAP